QHEDAHHALMLRRQDRRATPGDDHMIRALVTLLLIVANLPVAAASRVRAVRPEQPAPAATGNLGDPVRGLTAEQLGAWRAARAEFNEDKDVAGGLGPIFNDVSCLRCHSGPVAGGS